PRWRRPTAPPATATTGKPTATRLRPVYRSRQEGSDRRPLGCHLPARDTHTPAAQTDSLPLCSGAAAAAATAEPNGWPTPSTCWPPRLRGSGRYGWPWNTSPGHRAGPPGHG